MTEFQSRFTPKQIAMAAVAVFAVLFLILSFAKASGLNNTAVQRYETPLTAQFRNAQNYLSSYTNGFYEQTGVAKAKSDKLNSILLDAVEGRYDGKTSARPGGGQLFSAITEAYPELGGLDIYDKIADYIQAGRSEFRNQQSKLQDMIRSYDGWRKGGFIKPLWMKMAGVPTDALEARVNGQPPLHGEAALEKMKQMLISEEATEAYRSGVDKPLQIEK